MKADEVRLISSTTCAPKGGSAPCGRSSPVHLDLHGLLADLGLKPLYLSIFLDGTRLQAHPSGLQKRVAPLGQGRRRQTRLTAQMLYILTGKKPEHHLYTLCFDQKRLGTPPSFAIRHIQDDSPYVQVGVQENPKAIPSGEAYIHTTMNQIFS